MTAAHHQIEANAVRGQLEAKDETLYTTKTSLISALRKNETLERQLQELTSKSEQQRQDEMKREREKAAAAVTENQTTSLIPHVLELKRELSEMRDEIKREKASSKHKLKRTQHRDPQYVSAAAPNFRDEVRAAYLAVATSEINQQQQHSRPFPEFSIPASTIPQATPHTGGGGMHSEALPLPPASRPNNMPLDNSIATRLEKERERSTEITKLAEALGLEVKTLQGQLEAQSRAQDDDAETIQRLKLDHERTQKGMCGLEGQLEATKEKMNAEVVSKMRLVDERDQLKEQCNHWKGRCKEGMCVCRKRLQKCLRGILCVFC
jgi:hypothetical protein